MRQRVSRVALTAVIVSLLLLAVPFAIGIRISFFSDEATELERAALAAAIQVGPDFTAGDPVELPASPTDGQLAVYDTDRQLRAGAGPTAIDDITRSALSGKVSQGRTGGDLVIAVPVVAAEQVIGVVRSASPVSAIWTRVLLAWLGVAALAMVALLVGLAVGVRQARRLTRPLESLADVARSVAGGDLTARAAASGIPEIDAASAAQNAMVTRLSTVLDHARHFGTDASHQLRTPLAGLRLGLETALQDRHADARQSLEEALHRTEELQLTIEQVLALSRLTTQAPASEQFGTVDDLVDSSRQRWHGSLARDGRRVDFLIHDAYMASVGVPLNACQQILDVLIDNARTHGHGTVLVAARDVLGAVSIEVSDEGTIAGDGTDLFRRGVSGQAGSGVGLGPGPRPGRIARRPPQPHQHRTDGLQPAPPIDRRPESLTRTADQYGSRYGQGCSL
ncbi:histidine kinase dimerization/phospho-acceptor domain-containing protein [Kribbella qitaiheensis]|uniref:histidine kinase dimerization/phospho-acceptor domain-containing protein n=1 Tax=Kribbella qitaiheensis TaxID=1544730 RepID=UPI0019D5BD27|nr:HAMP domain-containing sensor histidine kinase [Kribbella qitaiheensis]